MSELCKTTGVKERKPMGIPVMKTGEIKQLQMMTYDPVPQKEPWKRAFSYILIWYLRYIIPDCLVWRIVFNANMYTNKCFNWLRINLESVTCLVMIPEWDGKSAELLQRPATQWLALLLVATWHLKSVSWITDTGAFELSRLYNQQMNFASGRPLVKTFLKFMKWEEWLSATEDHLRFS